jgi:hypothetical protein
MEEWPAPFEGEPELKSKAVQLLDHAFVGVASAEIQGLEP